MKPPPLGDAEEARVGLDRRPRIGPTRADYTPGERYPPVWNLDLRLARRVRLGENAFLHLTADLFNALNSGMASKRFETANSSAFERLEQILSPRIVRFGFRPGF